jgi:hypothetical protein
MTIYARGVKPKNKITGDKRVWRCAFQELIEEQTKKERNQSREKSTRRESHRIERLAHRKKKRRNI